MRSRGKTSASKTKRDGTKASFQGRFEVPLPPGISIADHPTYRLQALDTHSHRVVRVLMAQDINTPDGLRILCELLLYGRARHDSIPRILKVEQQSNWLTGVVSDSHGSTLEALYPPLGDPPDELDAIRHTIEIGLIVASVHDAHFILNTVGLSHFAYHGKEKKLQLREADACLPLESKWAREMFGPTELWALSDYVAPEQFQGAEAVSMRTDIFGLGATLYRLLAARSIHASEGSFRSGRALNIEPLRDLRPDLHKETLNFVDRCLEEDPAKRFPNMIETLKAMSDLFKCLGESFPHPNRPHIPATLKTSFPERTPLQDRLCGDADGLINWLKAEREKESQTESSPIPPFLKITSSWPKEDLSEEDRGILKESVRQNAQSLHAQLAYIVRASRDAVEQRAQASIGSRLQRRADGVVSIFRGLRSGKAASDVYPQPEWPPGEQSAPGAGRAAQRRFQEKENNGVRSLAGATQTDHHASTEAFKIDLKAAKNQALLDLEAIERQNEQEVAEFVKRIHVRLDARQERWGWEASQQREKSKRLIHEIVHRLEEKHLQALREENVARTRFSEAWQERKETTLKRLDRQIQEQREGVERERSVLADQERDERKAFVRERLDAVRQQLAEREERAHREQQEQLRKQQQDDIRGQVQRAEALRKWKAEIDQQLQDLAQQEKENWTIWYQKELRLQTTRKEEQQKRIMESRTRRQAEEHERMAKEKQNREDLNQINQAELEQKKREMASKVEQKEQDLQQKKEVIDKAELEQAEKARMLGEQRLKQEREDREKMESEFKKREEEEERLRKELAQKTDELETRTTELETQLRLEREAKVSALKERNELAEARAEADLKVNELLKRNAAINEEKESALKKRAELVENRRELDAKIAEFEIQLEAEKERFKRQAEEFSLKERRDREKQELRELEERERQELERRELKAREERESKAREDRERAAREEREKLLREEREEADLERMELEEELTNARSELASARQELDLKTASLESRLNKEREEKEAAQKEARLLGEARNELDATVIELNRRLEAVNLAKEAALKKATAAAEGKRKLEHQCAELDSILSFEREAKEDYRIKRDELAKERRELEAKVADLATQLGLETAAKETALRRGNDLAQVRQELEAKVADLDVRIIAEREEKEAIQKEHTSLNAIKRELEAGIAERNAMLASEKAARVKAESERDKAVEVHRQAHSRVAQLESEIRMEREAREIARSERDEFERKFKKSVEEILKLQSEHDRHRDATAQYRETLTSEYNEQIAQLFAKVSVWKRQSELKARQEEELRQKTMQLIETGATFEDQINQQHLKFNERLSKFPNGNPIPKPAPKAETFVQAEPVPAQPPTPQIEQSSPKEQPLKTSSQVPVFEEPPTLALGTTLSDLKTMPMSSGSANTASVPKDPGARPAPGQTRRQDTDPKAAGQQVFRHAVKVTSQKPESGGTVNSHATPVTVAKPKSAPPPPSSPVNGDSSQSQGSEAPDDNTWFGKVFGKKK